MSLNYLSNLTTRAPWILITSRQAFFIKIPFQLSFPLRSSHVTIDINNRYSIVWDSHGFFMLRVFLILSLFWYYVEWFLPVHDLSYRRRGFLKSEGPSIDCNCLFDSVFTGKQVMSRWDLETVLWMIAAISFITIPLNEHSICRHVTYSMSMKVIQLTIRRSIL